MPLDDEVCYLALRSRDRRFDGRFFIGVKTTGIYCRPICPARPPLRKNIRFFACAAAAEEAGFRPCRRCRPEVAPSTPAWNGSSTTVSRALALIYEGALDDGDGVEELARRVGVGSRHLRRLFVEHLGAAPLSIAATRRTHLAKQLLERSTLPMTDVAWSSGFGSLRRFNDAMRGTFGRAPRELRAAAPARVERTIDLRLAYRPPFDWDLLATFLGRRAIRGVEWCEGRVYTRSIAAGDAVGDVRVEHVPERHMLVVSIPPSLARSVAAISARARSLFDLAADPEPIASQLGRDPLLEDIAARHPGIRVPGAWDPFELAVRAIVGQQVSVAGAITILGRIAERYGERLDTSHAAIASVFPSADRLTELAYDIGMPRKRVDTIRALATAVADGTLSLTRGASLEETIRELCSLPGIGPWTAHYIAMRACGEPDAFPAGDLILRRNAGGLTERELERRAEAWRPWRAYAALLLWQRG